MPNTRPDNRYQALRLFAEGRITIAEAAELAKVSRQAARMWAYHANINPLRTRKRYLRQIWKRARRIANRKAS